MLTSQVKLALKQYCHHSLDTRHQGCERGLCQKMVGLISRLMTGGVDDICLELH